jgi:hypothetical protein
MQCIDICYFSNSKNLIKPKITSLTLVIDNITKYSILDKQIELSRPTGTGKIDFTLETEVIQWRTSTKKRQNMELFINIPCQVHFLVHRSTAPTD